MTESLTAVTESLSKAVIGEEGEEDHQPPIGDLDLEGATSTLLILPLLAALSQTSYLASLHHSQTCLCLCICVYLCHRHCLSSEWQLTWLVCLISSVAH